MLAAYSFAVVDQALRAHPLSPRREEAAMTAVLPAPASRQAVVEAALALLSGWACSLPTW